MLPSTAEMKLTPEMSTLKLVLHADSASINGEFIWACLLQFAWTFQLSFFPSCSPWRHWNQPPFLSNKHAKTAHVTCTHISALNVLNRDNLGSWSWLSSFLCSQVAERAGHMFAQAQQPSLGGNATCSSTLMLLIIYYTVHSFVSLSICSYRNLDTCTQLLYSSWTTYRCTDIDRTADYHRAKKQQR